MSLILDETKPINGLFLVKTKHCKQCCLWKPLSNFSAVSKVKNGKNSKCKECIKNRNREYYEKNRKHLYTKQQQKREEKEKQMKENEPEEEQKENIEKTQ